MFNILQAKSMRLGTTIPILILVLVIIVGFFIRINHLGRQSLWIDEGFTINAVQATLEHGYPLLDSGEEYWGMPLATYTSALSVMVFGFDPFSPSSARLPAVLFGTALILIVFLLTQALFKDKILALLPTIIIAFSAWEIAWSRQVRGYAALSFFVILTLWFLWKYFENRKWKYFLYASIAFLGAYLSHSLALVILPAFALVFIARWAFEKDIFKQINLKKILIYGGLVFIVSIIFFQLATRMSQLENHGLNTDYILFLSRELGIFFYGSIIGSLLGFFDKKRFWPVFTLFICFGLSTLIIVGYSPLIQFRYLLLVFPLMIIIFSYAIFRLIELSFSFLPQSFEKFIPASTFIISLLIALPHLSFFPYSYYNLELGSPQPDFRSVYGLIKQTKTADDVIISPYTHMTNIYLGEKGIWLPISLTGRASDLQRQIAKGMDHYTGAPLIENEKQLSAIIENKKGYIVLDMMATIRLRDQFNQEKLIYPKIKQIYHSGDGLNEIWLYKF
ncbi:MAG: glycosyltransferase family 39 protein [Candidatus Paceibacterota bacterium]|jgi:hypothetical protein